MLNIAIIGTGNISNAHIQGYLAFPDRCRIVALCDIVPEKAVRMKAQYSLDAEVYDSHEAMLASADIDLVSVCTPPFTHREIAVNALRSGRNVLVEKPMAASLEECDAILEAERESGRVLSVVAQNRFRTPVMRLKRVLDSGLAGDILHAQIDSLWWRGHCYYDLWWRGTWAREGGGCTLNHAVHHIDMTNWLKGMPSEVIAVLANTAHDNAEVEDLSVAILKYADGSLGQLTSSVVHHGEEQQMIFQGRNARVSVPWRVCASTSKENGFPEENPALEAEIRDCFLAMPELVHEGHPGQIDDVMRAIETGGAPLSRGEDGKRSLELITAIYRSGTEGVPVKLPLAKDDPFYSSAGMLARAKRFYEKTASVQDLGDDAITLGRNYDKAGW